MDNVTGFISNLSDTLKFLTIAIGGGVGVFGVIGFLEGYTTDNPGSKSQGVKAMVAGIGLMLVGAVLVPKLFGLFSFTL